LISTTVRRLQLPLTMLAVGLCLLAMGLAKAPTLGLAGLFYLAIGFRGLHKMRSRKPAADSAAIGADDAHQSRAL
jgi:hypothetical protein